MRKKRDASHLICRNCKKKQIDDIGRDGRTSCLCCHTRYMLNFHGKLIRLETQYES